MNNMIRTEIHSKTRSWALALLLSALVAACGDGGRAPILGIGGVPPVLAPTVTAVTPLNAAGGVSITAPGITATFDQAMAAISGGASFVVTCALPCTNPTGTVALDGTNMIATYTLTPLSTLEVATTYTVTITAAASLATGLTLVAPYVWTFSTASLAVLSTNPINVAVLVCPRADISAVFAVQSGLGMDGLTVNATNFTLVGPGALFVPVVATSITLDLATNTIATFNPSTTLVNGDLYTATIVGGASGVKDLAAIPNQLAANFVWTFTAGPDDETCLVPADINMGAAAPFAIAATAGLANAPTLPNTVIDGDVVLDPNQTCNSVTVPNDGSFGLCGGSPPSLLGGQVVTNTFPDAVQYLTVKNDLNAVFLSITPLAGPPAVGTLGGGFTIPAPSTLGNIAGSPYVLYDNYFTPGVYTAPAAINIADDITLDGMGNANAVFVFQAGSALNIAAGAVGPGPHTRILLIGGAKASNVWWQVGSSATIGTFAEFEGNILAAFDITMQNGATSCGRMMSGAWVGGSGALIFEANVVSIPGTSCPP